MQKNIQTSTESIDKQLKMSRNEEIMKLRVLEIWDGDKWHIDEERLQNI